MSRRGDNAREFVSTVLVFASIGLIVVSIIIFFG